MPNAGAKSDMSFFTKISQDGLRKKSPKEINKDASVLIVS